MGNNARRSSLRRAGYAFRRAYEHLMGVATRTWDRVRASLAKPRPGGTLIRRRYVFGAVDRAAYDAAVGRRRHGVLGRITRSRKDRRAA